MPSQNHIYSERLNRVYVRLQLAFATEYDYIRCQCNQELASMPFKTRVQ